MRPYFFLIILFISACDSLNFEFANNANKLQPVPITYQKAFTGSPSDKPFFVSTFEHNDPTNELWWEGNIGAWQTGILSGNYTLYASGVDRGVYSLVDSPLPTDDYVIRVEASTSVDAHEANQYGIIFDYQDSSTYGLYVISGYGQYSVGYFEDSHWYSLSNGELDIANMANRQFSLDLTLNREIVEAFINDEKIVSVQYSKRITGHFGVYLGSRITENAGLSIHEFSVSEYKT